MPVSQHQAGPHNLGLEDVNMRGSERKRWAGAKLLIALVSNVETVIKAREEVKVGATQVGTD